MTSDSEPRTVGVRITFDAEALRAFCRRWKVVELAFFGSVLRDDFCAESDIDVLVRWGDDSLWGEEASDAEMELEALFGRVVELASWKAIEESDDHAKRDSILDSKRVFYRRSSD
jgi:predicted nucleotidyltransferase